MTNTLYYIGWFIVVGTHLYMLFVGLPENQVVIHSILNLVAAGLIGYAWMKRS
jgi:hypothetical protein